MTKQILPHGGTLINRQLSGTENEQAKERAQKLKRLVLSERGLCDFEMISSGAMSPLEGFMGKADYEKVLSQKRLKNGLPWTIPVTKSITSEEKEKITKEKEA